MLHTLFYWCRECRHNFTEQSPDPTWWARCPKCYKDTEAYAVDEAANDAMSFEPLEIKAGGRQLLPDEEE